MLNIPPPEAFGPVPKWQAYFAIAAVLTPIAISMCYFVGVLIVWWLK